MTITGNDITCKFIESSPMQRELNEPRLTVDGGKCDTLNLYKIRLTFQRRRTQPCWKWRPVLGNFFRLSIILALIYIYSTPGRTRN